MFLVFSLVLNYDMYRFMKNPFKPPRMRMNRYFVWGGLVCLFILIVQIIVFILRVVLELEWIQLNITDDSKIYKSLELMLIYILYPPQLILNFIIVLKICIQLCRKGMSPKLMRAVLQRYMLVFLAVLPYYISSTLYYLGKYKILITTEVKAESLMILEIISLSLGLCIVIIRICEPFVYYTFKGIIAE